MLTSKAKGTAQMPPTSSMCGWSLKIGYTYTHILCTCILMAAQPLYKAEARMPPAVQSVSSSISLKIFQRNHSPHSNQCLACVSMLSGWSAKRLIEFLSSADWWHPFCQICFWSSVILSAGTWHFSERRCFVQQSESASVGVCVSLWSRL